MDVQTLKQFVDKVIQSNKNDDLLADNPNQKIFAKLKEVIPSQKSYQARSIFQYKLDRKEGEISSQNNDTTLS